MGFGVPLDYWFRGATWIEVLRDILLSRRACERGYFRRAEVERLIDDHVAGKSDLQNQLWMLLMLEMWHCTFIERDLATNYSSNSHLAGFHNRVSA
jgi:asparagine synthase (glutamine-hydrolysing)